MITQKFPSPNLGLSLKSKTQIFIQRLNLEVSVP